MENHWNSSVSELASSVLQIYQELDHELIEQSKTACAEEQELQKRKVKFDIHADSCTDDLHTKFVGQVAQREQAWAKIEELAAKNKGKSN